MTLRLSQFCAKVLVWGNMHEPEHLDLLAAWGTQRKVSNSDQLLLVVAIMMVERNSSRDPS